MVKAAKVAEKKRINNTMEIWVVRGMRAKDGKVAHRAIVGRRALSVQYSSSR